MSSENSGTPLYRILGFAGAGLIVALAVVLLVVYRPALKHESLSDRLVYAFEARLPASEPQVTGAGGETLRVSLTVTFDPTIDADEAHRIFESAVAVAEGQNLDTVTTVEISLSGRSLEGRPTSASRTFDYQPLQPPSR